MEPLSVDPDATAGTAVAVDGNGTSYLFAIIAGQGAAELQPSSTSASGYVVAPLPNGTGASEIVALVDGDGVLQVFYATDSGVQHVSRASGAAWTGPDTLLAATSLATCQVPLSGEWVVSGVSPDGNLVLYTESSGEWTAAKIDVGGALGGASARVQYTVPGAWVLFGVVGGALHIWSGVDNTIVSGPEVVTVANPVAAIHFTYLHANSAMVMFTDNKHVLYSSVGFGDTPAAIPISQVTQGSALVGPDGLIRFYGADPDGQLWVLRQTGWDSNDAPLWAPIFPLDRDVTYVAAPVLVGTTGALLVARVDGTIDYLSQDGVNGLWRRLAVQGSATKVPIRTTRYRTRLILNDANGTPCPGTSVTITPSSLVALEVAGQTVIASPDQPAVIAADVSGAIDVSQPATGLDAVTFSVTGTGIPSAVPVTPYAYLHTALAGNGSVFTGTGTIPPMSQSTIQNATVDGQPLAPNVSSDMAKVAASGITQAMSISTAGMRPGAAPAAGFELDLRDPDRPRFVVYQTSAEIEARMMSAPASAPGSIWDDIARYADDVWNAIKSGVMKVVHWVVDTTKMIVSATVAFADTITADLKNLAMKGIGAITSMVHGIFAAIGALVDKVLDWLKDVFGWTSIWNTMEAFDSYVINGLKAVSQWIDQDAVVATGHFFKDLKADINAQFDQAIKTVEGQTLGPASARALRARASGSGAYVSMPGSQAQGNWLLNKMTTHLPESSFLSGLDPGIDPKSLLSQLQSAIDSSGIVDDSKQELANFQQFFTDLYSHPRNLLDTLAADLLRVMEGLLDILLDAVDIVVVAVLDLVADVLAAVAKILNTPLPDIPVLTWLWENVLRPSGNNDPMTLGRLICLALAAPVTLAYRAAKGTGPFDGAARMALATGAMVPVLGDDDVMSDVRYYASEVLAVIDIINDIANAASGDEPNPLLVIWNWVDFAANTIIQILFWPVGSIFDTNWQWDQWTYGEKLTNGTWIGYWAPLLTDGTFTTIDTVNLIQGQSTPDAAAYVNQTLDWIFGLTLIGTGVAGAVYEIQENVSGVDAEDVFEAVVNPLPWGTQWLCYQSLVEASDGISVAVQVAVDYIGDIDPEDDPNGA